MSLRSARRQPCSMGSCMAVTKKRPSGLTLAPRCEPFQASVSGSALAFGNQSVAPLQWAMASRKPFGKKAKAPTVAIAHEQQRFLAKHEDCNIPDEMHGHHRRAGCDGPRALDDGRRVGTVHLALWMPRFRGT